MAGIAETEILLFDQCDRIDEARLESWMLLLPPWRQRVVARYRFHPDRVRSAAAFGLLCLGLGYIPQQFELGPQGKPFLQKGREFNLSHSGRYAAVAFSGGAVGVDVELLPRQYETVMEPVLTPAEQELVHRAVDPFRAFCKLWTLKESYIKALGKGLAFPLHDVEFALEVDGVGGGDSVICSDRRFVFSSFMLEDAELALCSLQPCRRLRRVSLDELERGWSFQIKKP